jgi:hypothetical protein
MQMKPVSWTKKRVRLECQECGAKKKLEWLSYLLALDSGAMVECARCGAHQTVGDRRMVQAPVDDERRIPIHV